MPAAVTVPTAPPLTTWRSVELARAGTWKIAVGGEQHFTADDFAAAVAATECPAVGRPVLKLGHLDTRGKGLVAPGVENRDGEPALGWVGNMARSSDGATLTGDLIGMPGWLGQIAASAYPSRSIEGARNFTCALGHAHPFVISAVALLGLTPPGVATIGSLQDHVRALYGVAASDTPTRDGEPFAVIFPARSKEKPVTAPVQIAAAISTEDVKKAFYSNAPADAWVCEIQLDPLQLIVQRDDGEYARVPVTVNGDGSFTFGQMVDVEVTYVDEAPEGATQGVAAAAGRPTRVRFPARTEVLAAADPEPPNDPTHTPTHTPSQGAPTPLTDPAQAPSVPPSPALPVTPSPEAPVAPVVPAAEPVPTTEPEGGTDVSLSEIRSRLGLDETADEAAVLAALDERLTKPTEPPAELVAAAAKADKQAAQFAAAISQISTLSTELAAVKAEKAAERKAAFFAAATAQGKIAPAERESWESRYDRDAELVAEILGAIKPGTAVPVAAAGYTGDPEPRLSDDDLLMLLPPEQRELTGKDA